MIIGPTLGRYFARHFLRAILIVFGTVFALIYTLDLVELMRRAGDAESASTATMALLALFRTPAVAEQALPFAILFGAMATLLNLSRRLELVIARAAGVSAWEFLQPFVLVAFLTGVVAVTAYNPLAAYLKQRASQIEAGVFARSQKFMPGREQWLRERRPEGEVIIRADQAVENSTTLNRVTFFNFNPDGTFRDRIEARTATLEDGRWRLEDGRIVAPGKQPERFTTLSAPSALDAALVRQQFTPPESVPLWDLPGFIARTRKAGLDATRYQLQLDVLIARPILLVAMVLVAASFSLRFFRFGGVAKMVLGGVVAGFMLYVATELTQDLGGSGLLGTAVAAWLPAVTGALLGVLALLYQEDG
ncbi:LPS export ABC transporter permease LptG [Camelimonas abortus]|uniref:LPS export ABC transporter permease LptG n=1 Tax=Camelimonas abortus TaxID=1017184 RepID=A0ABV7LHT4_9HYPH